MANVPEPDAKDLLKDLKRISDRERRKKNTLPYPDPVPETPLKQSKPPTLLEKVWANKWNLVRHFVIGGAVAGITALKTTKDWTVTGGAFIIGGLAEAFRKGVDDDLRANGKTDMLTTVKNVVTRNGKTLAKGDDMSIKSEVYGARDALASIGIKLTDDVPNKEQLAELLGDVVKLVTESVDFTHIPQNERLQAIAHAFIGAGSQIMDAAKYSDEV